MNVEDFQKILDGDQSKPEPKPTPGEIFRSVVGWAVAAVLVIVIPTAILCRDWWKVVLIFALVSGFAAIATTIACTGWQDED